MATTIGQPITTKRGNPGVLWVGPDQDGNLLEVIAAREADELIVTHVIPYGWEGSLMVTPEDDRTTVLLPGGPVQAEYDDTADVPYSDVAADELLEAARDVERTHPDLFPGRPSLSRPRAQSPHVSFRVPENLAQELSRQSEEEGVTRSVLARRALAKYLSDRRAS